LDNLSEQSGYEMMLLVNRISVITIRYITILSFLLLIQRNALKSSKLENMV